MLIGYAHAIIRAFVRSLPTASERLDRRGSKSHLDASGRCGLCPACGAFVFIELADPEASARCPRCEREIDHLDSLT